MGAHNGDCSGDECVEECALSVGSDPDREDDLLSAIDHANERRRLKLIASQILPPPESSLDISNHMDAVDKDVNNEASYELPKTITNKLKELSLCLGQDLVD